MTTIKNSVNQMKGMLSIKLYQTTKVILQKSNILVQMENRQKLLRALKLLKQHTICMVELQK